MAIDKKLIHFKQWSTFISSQGVNGNYTTPSSGTAGSGSALYGQIKETSIVFIQDVQRIWTHGKLYECSSPDLSKYLTAEDLSDLNSFVEKCSVTKTGSGNGETLTVTVGDSSNSITNTWRTVQVNGSSISNNTLNLKAGTNITLSKSNGEVTITGASFPTSLPANGGTADKANTLTNAKTIDGVDFNGSANITHYGTCGTAAGTAAKTVSLTGYKLATGAKVAVKFTVTNTAANPTLNVNSTGAKAIYYRGAAISKGYLAANRVYEFVYDGTNYELIGDINTDTDTNTAHSHSVGTGLSASGSGGTSGTTTYSLKTAAADEIGGIKVASVGTAASGANTTVNANKFAVHVDSNGLGYVAIPQYSNNNGDITGVTAGKGLTGGATSGTATLNVGAGTGITVADDSVSANLNSTTSLGTIGTTDKLYAVGVDANGKLAVNVPWKNDDTKSFTITASASDDDVVVLSGTNGTNKVTYSASHAKKLGDGKSYTSGNTTTSISGSGAAGTIKIPQITVDSYGHVTAAADESITITMPTIPSLSGGAAAESGKYVSGVTVSGHAVTVTKGNLPTIPTTLKNPNAITLQVNGSTKVTYDGSSAQTFNVTASDLGLSAAMRFRGTTTTAISDGSTTKTVTIGSASHTAISGDVVLYNNKEFIWNGSSWEEFGYPVDLSGYITGVTAGNGLTGGGSSGDVTLHVGAGTGISVASDSVSVVYGTTAGTACQGNDSRLSNARPASDVYAWAKKSALALSDVPDLSTKYLSLSGGTITSSSQYALQINSSYANAWATFVQMLNSKMSTTNHTCNIAFGYKASAKNLGYIGFKYKGTDSTSNMLTMGLHSVDNVINVLGTGDVGIGTESPAAKLDVAGDIKTSGSVKIQSASITYDSTQKCIKFTF